MTTAVIKVDISQLDSEDNSTIRFACDQENERRKAASVEPLDFSTGALRKAYYESLMAKAVEEIHKRNIQNSARQMDNQQAFKDLRAAWASATPAQRNAAIAAMTSAVPG